LTAPVVQPVISFESTGMDAIYNAAEVGADGTITATVKAPTEVLGDYLVINGGTPIKITQNEIDNGIAVEVVPGSAITAVIQDAAGNAGTSVTATAPSADLQGPAAPVVNPSNGTGISGTAEIGSTVKLDL